MNPTITHNSKVSLYKYNLMKELDGEAILLNLNNNQYYRLDENSLRMYQAILSSDNLGIACTTLKGEYDVPVEQLWQDLVRFVNELESAGIVQVQNA